MLVLDFRLNIFFFTFFSFIVVLSGSMLWYLQRILQYQKCGTFLSTIFSYQYFKCIIFSYVYLFIYVYVYFQMYTLYIC
jgi:hypothetical protein